MEIKDLPKVEINYSSLFSLNLSPDLYLLLYYKYNNINLDYLPVFFKQLNINELSLKYLEDEGYIKIVGVNIFDLRDKAIQLFNPNTFDQMYYELLSTYPMKVMTRQGTYRILRPKDPDANLNKEAKKKYFKIIKGNNKLHDTIMKSLHAELENKKSSNSLGYMQNFITWLNQQSWEMYEGIEEDTQSSSETSLN